MPSYTRKRASSEIVTRHRLLVTRAVEFVLGIQQVEQVALTDEEFLAVRLHGFARLDSTWVVEILDLIDSAEVVRDPGEAQRVDHLAANARGEFLLLEDGADPLLLLGSNRDRRDTGCRSVSGSHCFRRWSPGMPSRSSHAFGGQAQVRFG